MSNIYSLNSISNNPPNRPNNNSNLYTSAYTDIESGRNQNRSCIRTIFPTFKFKSFCFFIIVLNILIYLAELTLFKAKENYIWNCLLYDFGAKYTPAIKHDLQIYRLILPIFLHGSLTHVIMNCLSIFFLGFFVENFFGTAKTIILYFTCGIYALFLSSIIDTENISVGASGSIMGFSGFFILYYLLHWRHLNDNEKKFFFVFVVFTLMNLFPKGKNIDMFAHMGGFVTGFVVSILLFGIDQIKYEDQIPIMKKAKVISTAILIVFLGFYLGFIFNLKIGLNQLGYYCNLS